jgi:glycosyltransferase involved in cell wall biosynthesis
MAPVVLHVAQPTDAGVARWVVDHSAHQVAAGWDVHVACPSTGWLGREAAAAGATTHAWRAVRSPYRGVSRETRALSALVADLAPDVVHLHSSKAGLDGRLAIRGRTPTVFAPHAWSFDGAGHLTGVVALRWERTATRWADRVLCVSAAERDRAVAAGVRGRYDVVPNGVDLTRHRPAAAAERVATREAAGLAADAPLAVCVGRLSRQKGQDLLVDAWALVRDAVPGARLVLVGDGPDRESLAGRAGDGVLLVGEVADPRPWYAAADLVVAPSRWEGMAFVPLEAMAAGRSVVAFDVTGIRESVPADAGRVVPAGDVPALATAMQTRLVDRDLSEAEGSAGRAHVAAHHDLRRTAPRVVEIYESAVRTRSAGPAAPDAASSTWPNSH